MAEARKAARRSPFSLSVLGLLFLRSKLLWIQSERSLILKKAIIQRWKLVCSRWKRFTLRLACSPARIQRASRIQTLDYSETRLCINVFERANWPIQVNRSIKNEGERRTEGYKIKRIAFVSFLIVHGYRKSSLSLFLSLALLSLPNALISDLHARIWRFGYGPAWASDFPPSLLPIVLTIFLI